MRPGLGDHVILIERRTVKVQDGKDTLTPHNVYQIECSCGWKERWYRSFNVADTVARGHVIGESRRIRFDNIVEEVAYKW